MKGGSISALAAVIAIHPSIPEPSMQPLGQTVSAMTFLHINTCFVESLA